MKVVPVILLAYLIYGLSYPLNIGIMLKDRTRYLPMIGWIAAVICLGLNFWWIPIFGMWGAAWATVVAYIIWTGGIAWVSLRLYPVKYSLWQVGTTLVAGIVGYVGLWLSDQVMLHMDYIPLIILRLFWVMGVMTAEGLLLWHHFRKKAIDASVVKFS
jgi:O-antigen/teichoic acid export membrane protein